MTQPEPIYGQTGGCSVGPNSWLVTNWTWPFAGIYLYRDELVLSMSFQRFTFRRDEITRISRYSNLTTTGLRIEHNNADIPAFIVFWPLDLEECEEALDANAFVGESS